MAQQRNGNGNGSGVPLALIYTRVSTDEQAREGLSLAAQLADCRRYAAMQAWVLGDEYQDVLSGKRDDRPQYQALLADIRRLRAEGRPVVVVVKWLHRFGRHLLERARCADELRELGVPIHSVQEGGQVQEFVGNVLAAVAQEEIRQLSERVSAVRQNVQAAGWFFPGRCPWGYHWRERTDDEKGQGAPKLILEPDPERAPYLQEAFRRAQSGIPGRAVSRWIQELPASVRNGLHYNPESTRGLLRSPVYASRPGKGDPDVLARPRCRWEPLVDDDTWLAAQRALDQHKRVPKQASNRYLLTGFLRCPVCGGRLCGGYTSGGPKNQGRKYPHYVCRGETLGAASKQLMCTWSCSCRLVDSAVLGRVGFLIERLLSTSSEMREHLAEAYRQAMQPADESGTVQQRHTLERIVVKGRERLATAARKLVDGDLDKFGYDLLRDQINAELDAAESELARLPTSRPVCNVPSLSSVLAQVASWTAILDSAEPTQQRRILAVLIETVIPRRLSRGKYALDITWTPTGELLRDLVLAFDEVGESCS